MDIMNNESVESNTVATVMEKKVIKSILIKATIKGQGIVNFDSNDQKWLWNRQNGVEKCRHSNVMFGKGRYYPDNSNPENPEGVMKKAIISADCIRHVMYEEEMSTHLPNIMHDDSYLLRAVASPAFVERGYLFAKDDTWKRKSALTLSYAKAIDGSVSAIETYSNSQPKLKTLDKTDADNSFFKREVRGDVTYELSGAIDLRELGFISISDVHDRMSFAPDYAKQYRKNLSEKLGSEVPEDGYHLKNGDIYDIPERGINLTQDQVKYLALDILKRLAKFNISRSTTGNARMVSVSIKLVSDPLVDIISDDEGWITIWSEGKPFMKTVLDEVDIMAGYTKVDLVEEAKAKIKGYKEKFNKKK